MLKLKFFIDDKVRMSKLKASVTTNNNWYASKEATMAKKKKAKKKTAKKKTAKKKKK